MSPAALRKLAAYGRPPSSCANCTRRHPTIPRWEDDRVVWYCSRCEEPENGGHYQGADPRGELPDTISQMESARTVARVQNLAAFFRDADPVELPHLIAAVMAGDVVSLNSPEVTQVKRILRGGLPRGGSLG